MEAQWSREINEISLITSMKFPAISTYSRLCACFPLPRIFQLTQICWCGFSFGYKFVNGFCAAQVGAGMNNDFVAAVSVPGVGRGGVHVCGE